MACRPTQDENRVNFESLGPGLFEHVMSWLYGYEVVPWTCACHLFSAYSNDEQLWNTFRHQEFPDSCHVEGIGFSRGISTALAQYKWSVKTSRCRGMSWYRIPCRHHLGAREGSPGLFACYGYLFVYGGWSFGPTSDLHVARLTTPLTFRRVSIAGDGVPDSYEMAVTLLTDGKVDGEAAGPVQVAVTGGWLLGGYHHASPSCGIMEITFPDASVVSEVPHESLLPTARWLHCSRMAPRANHSATYIPPRLASPFYEKGYLLIFGGCLSGEVSNSIDVLDLATMTWEFLKPTTGALPHPRNSHSAILMRTRKGDRVIIAGGGTGDASNGGPPRGGADLRRNVFMLDPREFSWEVCDGCKVCGRGHFSFTHGNSLVMFSGGNCPGPKFEMIQLVASESKHACLIATPVSSTTDDSVPCPRAFGGSCSLPDGSFLMFGGWHPFRGTFADLWIGHVTGCPTKYCELFCGECVWQSVRGPRSSAAKFLRKIGVLFSVVLEHPAISFLVLAIAWNFLSRIASSYDGHRQK